MFQTLVGILITFIGFVIVWKSEWLLSNLGHIEWAEEHLSHEGGSRLFYKLLGVLAVFMGLFVITGIWADILNAIAGIFIRK